MFKSFLYVLSGKLSIVNYKYYYNSTSFRILNTTLFVVFFITFLGQVIIFDSSSRKHWVQNNVKLHCRWQLPLRPFSEQIRHISLRCITGVRLLMSSVFRASVPIGVIVRCDIWLCLGVCLISNFWQPEQVWERDNHHLVTERDRHVHFTHTSIHTYFCWCSFW